MAEQGKAKRAGQEPYVPFINMDDAIGAINCFVPCKYGEDLSLSEEIQARLYRRRHLLGSASIETG